MADTNLYSPAELLARLVAFQSVVGTPNADIVAFVRAYLKSHGAAVDVLPGPEGDRSNLFASFGPRDVPGYVLSGHLDVVPVEGQPGWLSDPFALRQVDDRLIGRGAVDMKGFVAAALSLAPELSNMALSAPIHFALSYDEEAGCKGVPHLIRALPDLCAPPLGCIIGEPSGLVPILRHKGKATLRLTAQGKAGHSSRPDEGRNAIHMLVPALNAAICLEAELRMGLQHASFDPPYSTVQIGTLTGGTAVNMIPEGATALIELRALPDLDPAALLSTIHDTAEAHGATAEIVAQYPGLSLDESSDLTRLVSKLSGQSPIPAVSFGTEAGLFSQAGYPAIICGPGDIARAHRAEEFITLDELDNARAFLLRLAHQVSQ